MVGIRAKRTQSPSKNSIARGPAVAGSFQSQTMMTTSTAALILLLVALVFLVLNPSCLGGGGRAGDIPGTRSALINQTTADEINSLVMKFENINLRKDRSQADSSVASVFAAANTAFKYHMQQRAASFVRDKVGPADKLRWTEAKMREIFLVPVYACPVEIRVGEWGEGGKWLCNIFPFRHALRGQAAGVFRGSQGGTGFAGRLDWKRPPVVWSVGSRDETSFEDAVHRLLNVEPYTMDPSLSEKKQEHLKTLPFIHFYNIGLTGASKKQSPKSWGPLLPFTEVMDKFNHSYVDVLKIDCESCEIEVMSDLLARFGSKPPVGQVLMEIHHMFLPKVQLDLLLTMEKLGFRMFHSENNERYLKAHEVAYIHESIVDPSLWPSDSAAAR